MPDSIGLTDDVSELVRHLKVFGFTEVGREVSFKQQRRTCLVSFPAPGLERFSKEFCFSGKLEFPFAVTKRSRNGTAPKGALVALSRELVLFRPKSGLDEDLRRRLELAGARIGKHVWD
jgi:hypothetical protein